MSAWRTHNRVGDDNGSAVYTVVVLLLLLVEPAGGIGSDLSVVDLRNPRCPCGPRRRGNTLRVLDGARTDRGELRRGYVSATRVGATGWCYSAEWMIRW
jgi:hypothetical protein